jgi:ADP-ribosylation factor GTPase-activating protein 2/3
MSGLASKQQSLKIFEKLKTKPANKASLPGPAIGHE